ncbi:MAG: DUF2249 domain-containing protein [Candidatus Competibacteraceae bacterium]|nr:DUF2249 domain-containing protein [Candidatus Competibacteraceae bacterium]MBK7982196.1 DUF2249 domain-containing protein [Candidatus Competibacteraceae bacterium]MBK8899251.1 DUF2249 domain-containing protein [Candidatus Competibacteraceae bacterium]MBK8963290.1 DUF2249 domain-containing protein [Candidatus Competibacteraceae bacterium]MBK9952250.1 DUF2249 domain-containing protein [Candidatus Competibacteraceae bacterium]
MSALEDIVVDGRGLEPPEPMEKVLAALDELQPGQRIRFLIHRQPYPLYDILRRYRYRYEITAADNGEFEILISGP